MRVYGGESRHYVGSRDLCRHATARDGGWLVVLLLILGRER